MIRDLVFLKECDPLDYMELRYTGVPNAPDAITIYPRGIGPAGITVTWGDGTTEFITTPGPKTHTYATSGNKVVRIFGELTAYGAPFAMSGSPTDNGLLPYYRQDYLTGCTAFNTNTKDLAFAFAGAVDTFNQVPARLPNGVTNLRGMFFGYLTSFGRDLTGWDTSAVTDMGYMFWNSSNGNVNVTNWNTSSVTKMDWMFATSVNFNRNIANWNVSNVTNMERMFYYAANFNQNISPWNVSNVTNMDRMFADAYAFNQNLTPWVTGLTAQPLGFANSGNFTWISAAATKFPFLADGVTRIIP